MKICILSTRYREGSGGMYAYERNIKERLEEQGHEVHIIAPEVGEEHREEATVHKAKTFGVYPLKNFFTILSFSFSSFLLLSSLNKEVNKFDIVYTMGGLGANAFLIRVILKIPVVNHAPFPSKYRLKAEKGWRKWAYLFPLSILEKFALLHSNKIIVLSEVFKEEVLPKLYHVNKNRIRVIPNGVDIPEEGEKPDCKTVREKYRIRENALFYLFVGWVTEKKGIYDLLAAFDLLDKSNKKLLIVGAIDKAIKGITSKKYKNVIFTGYLPDQELIKIFKCADIFVFPSRSEGQPFTVLEAMGYSLPVITTNRDGMVDQVDDGETGFLVPAQNPKELADKMELITKLDYKKMGRLSREKAKREFSWQYVIGETIKVFEEVIK